MPCHTFDPQRLPALGRTPSAGNCLQIGDPILVFISGQAASPFTPLLVPLGIYLHHLLIFRHLSDNT